MALKEVAIRKLDFTLDPKSGVPYYKQIIMQVELAIIDGRLEKGEQLPTVRALAVDLRINPNTVGRAYNEMEIRGIVTTQQGMGTFVSNKKIKMDDLERERILAQIVRSFIIKAGSYGFAVADIVEYLQQMNGKMANPSNEEGEET
ncbi:GntR family transcriptional regulator [Oceanispirochaeta crateris]|uniref:GntR family transcriptional regulator n=1 Tax=Oceanispirochaeta crateris TaxID=2518645 RepID=A0A5C1QHB2_9SPIO|nr:GntR family transcriptional regulator [Oceanispirochaeta crateris]QEN06887.1 GntR family transcriptional regulator [Oceanispirochaeta crateris]